VLDFLIAWRGHTDANRNVVLVKVDDETNAEFGWPLPRSYYARLVKKLNAYGARVIVLDFLFNDRTSFSEDTTLVYTIDEAGNVINSFNFQVWSGEQNYKAGAQECIENSHSRYAVNLNPDAIINFYRASFATFPHEDFVDFFEKAGHVNIVQDVDGHFRRIPLFICYEGCFYPSLGFKAISEYFNISGKDISIERSLWGDNLLLKIQFEKIKVPINNKGQVLLNYYGDLDVFQQYSLPDVLNGNISASHFKDKIVLVGQTMTGDKDSHVIPFSADFPGMGFHATLISNLFDKNFIKEIPFVANFLILLLLSMVVALYPYKKYQNLLYLTIFPFIWIIALVIVGYCLIKFEIGIWWLKIVQYSFTILFSFIGVTVLEKWEAHKELEEITNKIAAKEQTLIKMNDETRSLDWKFETLNSQLKNIESTKNVILNIAEKASENFKEYFEKNFKSVFDMQNEIKENLEQQVNSIEEVKLKIESSKDDLEKEIDQLQKKKSDIKKITVGAFQKIEIFTEEPKIIIEGSKGKTVKLRFSPQLMAFIYYLARAKLSNKPEEWIVDSVINKTKMTKAKKASETYHHVGIVGCNFIGKPPAPAITKHVKLEDYVQDPGEAAKLSSLINAKMKDIIHEETPLIRTPGSEKVRDGKYYLVDTIKKVVIHTD